MFVEIRYGHNETLICNPYCIVINLIQNIKERTGFNGRHIILDLSDETGLIKDLDLHRLEKADKYLTNQGPYILVEKQEVENPYGIDYSDPNRVPSPSEQREAVYNYRPLLDDCEGLFPEFKVRVAHAEKKHHLKKPRPVAVVAKSPSPAGKKPKKRATKKK